MNKDNADTIKVKERLITQSHLGFILNCTYILVSVVFWVFLYFDKTFHLFSDYLGEISIFCMSAIVLGAGLVMSIIGVVLAGKREDNRSKKFSILGLVIIGIGFVANFTVFLFNIIS